MDQGETIFGDMYQATAKNKFVSCPEGGQNHSQSGGEGGGNLYFLIHGFLLLTEN